MSIVDENQNWNYEIDIDECEKRSNNFFELRIKKICEDVCKVLTSDNNGSSSDDHEDKECVAQNNEEELSLLIERNKELKQEIEIKLKELSQQQAEYENYKQDQKLLMQEVKETHETFLLARKHFKKCLNIYYSIESRSEEAQVIYIQFFTETRKNGEPYTTHLLKNVKTKQYILQSVNPTIKNFKDLQKKLQDTNDVPSILCCIRQAFIAHKQKNKDPKKE